MQVGKTSAPSREAAKDVQESRFSQFLARLFKRAGYKNSSSHPGSLLRFLGLGGHISTEKRLPPA